MGLRFGRDVNAYTSYDETVNPWGVLPTTKQNLQQVTGDLQWRNR